VNNSQRDSLTRFVISSFKACLLILVIGLIVVCVFVTQFLSGLIN